MSWYLISSIVVAAIVPYISLPKQANENKPHPRPHSLVIGAGQVLVPDRGDVGGRMIFAPAGEKGEATLGSSTDDTCREVRARVRFANKAETELKSESKIEIESRG